MQDNIWFWANYEMEANSIVHVAASLILHHQSWSPVVETWFTLITFWFRLKAIRTRATHSIVFISTSIIVIINTMIPELVYKLCWNITKSIVQSKAYMRVTMWIGGASTYCPSRIQSLEGIQKHERPVWIWIWTMLKHINFVAHPSRNLTDVYSISSKRRIRESFDWHQWEKTFVTAARSSALNR